MPNNVAAITSVPIVPQECFVVWSDEILARCVPTLRQLLSLLHSDTSGHAGWPTFYEKRDRQTKDRHGRARKMFFEPTKASETPDDLYYTT